MSNGTDRDAERIIADLDLGDLNWSLPDSKAISVWSKMETKSRKLSKGELHLLRKIWDHAFQEKPSIPETKTTDRYDEILILVEGEKARTVRARGPIQREKAKAAVDPTNPPPAIKTSHLYFSFVFISLI